MRLGLVSAAYPPVLDGIGDYTWWLAKTLAERGDVEKPVTVFTRIGDDHSPAPGVKVVPFFDPTDARTFARLSDFFSPTSDLRPPTSDFRLSTFNLDWLILQYNPFSWGRRGYCPRVPWTLQRLRRLQDGPGLAVMFHETTVPRWPWRFSVMFMWQWPVFRSVCRAAEMAFVSTSKWMPQIRVSKSLPTWLLPVGSNIPVNRIPMAEARRLLSIDPDTIAIGVFGATHVSRMLDWIHSAALRVQKEYPKTVLLYVGSDGSTLVKSCPGICVIDAGSLPSDEIGTWFCAMDFCLAPFVDGLCSRRGSIIALLQHGIPTAGRRRPFIDQVFENFSQQSLLRSDAENAAQFADDVAQWARGLLASQQKGRRRAIDDGASVFGWKTIAETMVDRLSQA